MPANIGVSIYTSLFDQFRFMERWMCSSFVHLDRSWSSMHSGQPRNLLPPCRDLWSGDDSFSEDEMKFLDRFSIILDDHQKFSISHDPFCINSRVFEHELDIPVFERKIRHFAVVPMLCESKNYILFYTKIETDWICIKIIESASPTVRVYRLNSFLGKNKRVANFL